MQKKSVQAIICGLNDAGVRYLIAGGLAVVAHGYGRFTADVDLILDLEAANVRKALRALAALGYRPRAPVRLEDSGDPNVRAKWIQKGMTVFSMDSPAHPATEIDFFVELPLDFDKAHRSALKLEMTAGIMALFVGFDDLVALKQKAGRPLDLTDLEQLRLINERKSE